MYHFGFIVEQALGHITHTKNIRAQIEKDRGVEAFWGLPAWETSGMAAKMPVYRNNWTVRASLRARGELRNMQQALQQKNAQLDALFFHTQITAALNLDWVERVPSIVSLDATPLQYDQLGSAYDHRSSQPWIEDQKLRLYKRCFRSTRRLVTWSAWTKQGLVDNYEVPAEKIYVIPPGVDIYQWTRTVGAEPGGGAIEHGEAAKPSDAVKILFVGGNLERKGGHLLLNAFRRLRAHSSQPVELHLVTRDSVPAEQGVFVYNDLQPNSPALIHLYHTCEIFCLPTSADCLPLALVEAAAAGMTTISTRIAGIPEIVKDEETGLLIPPGDEDALLAALLRLVADPAMLGKMGEAAVQHVRQNFDAECNGLRLLNLMKEIAEEEKARLPR